jgi:hypothetical protein
MDTDTINSLLDDLHLQGFTYNCTESIDHDDMFVVEGENAVHTIRVEVSMQQVEGLLKKLFGLKVVNGSVMVFALPVGGSIFMVPVVEFMEQVTAGPSLNVGQLVAAYVVNKVLQKRAALN